jgi:hypothetical protein
MGRNPATGEQIKLQQHRPHCSDVRIAAGGGSAGPLGDGEPPLGPAVAIGIWRMKRYAMAVAWIYAVYVILNLALFTIRNPPAPTEAI